MTTEKLCYVDGSTAYFTTQSLSDQWGDDWNDAPYEHNAETPYSPSIHYYADGTQKKSERDWNSDGTPKWEITEVKFDADVMTPCDGFLNSPYSVEQVNAGLVPWLRAPFKSLYAGASISQFRDFIASVGGSINTAQG